MPHFGLTVDIKTASGTIYYSCEADSPAEALEAIRQGGTDKIKVEITEEIEVTESDFDRLTINDLEVEIV